MEYLTNKCKTHFGFLQQDFGFFDFKTEYWREEINVYCQKNNHKISLATTIYDSSPIFIYINGKNILTVEPDNEKLKILSKVSKEKIDDYFNECARVLKSYLMCFDDEDFDITDFSV